MDLSLNSLTNVLNRPQTLESFYDETSPLGFRDAAVVVPLVLRDGEVFLIFNKRAANLDNHAGQVSFPGGRRDPEDISLLVTAKRELQEELSIPEHQHRVLCRLPARLVISNYKVTPFVSVIDPGTEIIADPGEVAYAFEVPLRFLAVPGAAVSVDREVFGEMRTFYAWEHKGETIWGATGRIIADFLIALGVSHFDA